MSARCWSAAAILSALRSMRRSGWQGTRRAVRPSCRSRCATWPARFRTSFSGTGAGFSSRDSTSAGASTRSTGRTPEDIAFGEGSLWVANLESGTISEIDPGSREEVATFNAGAKPRGIAAGEGAVWVANGFDNELTIFDPDQDRVDDRISLAGPKDVAVGFGAAWVANITDTSVVRIDPDTHDPERIAEGSAVALGPNAVWIANGKTLRRFDHETRKPIGRPFTLRFPATQLAVDEEGVVWVTHQGDDAVSRVDPAGGASQIEGVGDAPTGIAVGGGSVWVASSLGRSLIRIGPESRKVEQAIPLGSSPKGIVVAAGSVWVTTQAAG